MDVCDTTLVKMRVVVWIRRTLLLLPFGIAATLNLLAVIARPLHLRGQRIAGYGFLFATPGAGLIDHDWFGRINNKWVEAMTAYFLILWIPAILYSACLWLGFRVLRRSDPSRSSE